MVTKTNISPNIWYETIYLKENFCFIYFIETMYNGKVDYVFVGKNGQYEKRRGSLDFILSINRSLIKEIDNQQTFNLLYGN